MKKIILVLFALLSFVVLSAQPQYKFMSQPGTNGFYKNTDMLVAPLVDNGMDFTAAGDENRGDPEGTTPEGWGSGYWTPEGDAVAQTSRYGHHNDITGHWSRVGFGDGTKTGKGTWCWWDPDYVWYDILGWKHTGAYFHQTYTWHPPVDMGALGLILFAYVCTSLYFLFKKR